MDTVKSLGVKMDTLGLDYFIPDKEEVPLDWLPSDFQRGYAIGAQQATKKLPLNKTKFTVMKTTNLDVALAPRSGIKGAQKAILSA
jgi:hypothetical protein